MSRHRDTNAGKRRGRRRSGRLRAFLSLGVLLLLAVSGTAAFWTDSATVTTGPVTSGAMDLQISNTGAGGSWGAVNPDVEHAAGHITVADITPGEAFAFPLYVRNVGRASMTTTATVRRASAPGWTYVDDPIAVRLFLGEKTASPTSYPIQEGCSGGSLADQKPVLAAPTSLFDAPLALSGGQQRTLCVLVSMRGDAGNVNQTKTGALRIDFSAEQVLTP